MKVRINMVDLDCCAVSLETEPPSKDDTSATFFTLHASTHGAAATLFLRAEDLSVLYRALGDHLFNERREIQE